MIYIYIIWWKAYIYIYIYLLDCVEENIIWWKVINKEREC